jgi:GNAT superfamily N-acetyltransferase
MEYMTTRDGYVIDTDPERIDIPFVHHYLSEESYWAKGIPFAVVERSVNGSLCFGLYHEGRQVGFARLITDRATFGYLADVFIIPEHRGKGLSLELMEAILAHPDLNGLRRILLATSDAHGLYRRFGFTGLADPGIIMQLHRPGIYTVK